MAQANSLTTISGSLLPTVLTPDSFYNNKLRIVSVQGDGMQPRLREGDFVVVKPVDDYVGEGTYLVQTPFGTQLINVQSAFATQKKLRLWHENKGYLDDVVSGHEFENIVLAIVVADVRVRAEQQLRDLLNH